MKALTIITAILMAASLVTEVIEPPKPERVEQTKEIVTCHASTERRSLSLDATVSRKNSQQDDAVDAEPEFEAYIASDFTPGPELSEITDTEPEYTYLGCYWITGYDICLDCCEKLDGITASGTVATVGVTVAADDSLPFGTVLWIDGIGERVVEDRGGGIDGQHIDVLCEDHEACYAVTGWYDVYVVG